MIKKIEKEILKFEKLSQQKCEKRKEIDDEINDINTKLKDLYSLRNQFEKLQVGAENVIKNL